MTIDRGVYFHAIHAILHDKLMYFRSWLTSFKNCSGTSANEFQESVSVTNLLVSGERRGNVEIRQLSISKIRSEGKCHKSLSDTLRPNCPLLVSVSVSSRVIQKTTGNTLNTLLDMSSLVRFAPITDGGT